MLADQPWLLALDNADEPEVLRHAWPRGANGSVLVTSRNPALASSMSSEAFEVQPFDDSEGARVLLQFSGLDLHSSANQSLSKDVAHALGGLPLALNQIG